MKYLLTVIDSDGDRHQIECKAEHEIYEWLVKFVDSLSEGTHKGINITITQV